MLSFFSEFFSAAWFFVLGTCIGSFLNVVVYRVPAGRSLNGPSRCPNCDSTIKWYDNIPVLGWLMLQGRCRNCQVDISARYPRVEFLLGLVFLSLAICDVALGLVNWPGVQLPHYKGFAWHLFDPSPEYLFVFTSDAILMAILLGATLIEFDRKLIPLGLIIFMFIGFLIVTTCSPALPDGSERKVGDLFAAFGGFGDFGNWDIPSLRIRSAGVLYGSFVGNILGWAYTRRDSSTDATTSLTKAGPMNIVMICALLGGWLGLFAMTCITVLTALICRLTETLGFERAKVPSLAGVGAATASGQHALDHQSESPEDDEPPASVWPRLPLGQLFTATWIYLLTAGAIAKLEIAPIGWDRGLWIGVLTGMSVAIFFRHRAKSDMGSF